MGAEGCVFDDGIGASSRKQIVFNASSFETHGELCLRTCESEHWLNFVQ